jgi:hypothetical protein
MNWHWILAAAVFIPTARAQQVGGGATGSGTVGTVLPQVAPGLQQNNNAGGGISFVTRRTSTAVSASQAGGFFAAGGVSLGGATAGAGGSSVGGGSAGGMAAGLVAAEATRRSVALPSEVELASTAAAAQRGDAKAQARLAEYRRALTGANAPAVAAPVAAVAPQPVRAAKSQDSKRRTSPANSGNTVK